MSEIARAHAGCDHQKIECNLANAGPRTGRIDRAVSEANAGDLRQEYAEVSLLHLELTDWRSDLGGREDRRRHLV